MQAFDLLRPSDTKEALALIARHDGAAFIAGGTTVLDLMKCGVTAPLTLIDINNLPLARIDTNERCIRLGALARNSDVAYHPAVSREIPMLSQAFLAGASPQLRNMATVGGNLLQRTRCTYFRDPAAACNKRREASGCDASEGLHRMHAILGTSDSCFAAHASDAAVALVALDAVVEIEGASGSRRMPLEAFYVPPGRTPWIENALEAGELITAVEVSLADARRSSIYLKVRDRASYEFALVSVAAGVDVRDRRFTAARLAMGGVGTIPWRARDAEHLLIGKEPSEAVFHAAARAALSGARTRRDNAFKVALAENAVVRALRDAVGAR